MKLSIEPKVVPWALRPMAHKWYVVSVIPLRYVADMSLVAANIYVHESGDFLIDATVDGA